MFATRRTPASPPFTNRRAPRVVVVRTVASSGGARRGSRAATALVLLWGATALVLGAGCSHTSSSQGSGGAGAGTGGVQGAGSGGAGTGTGGDSGGTATGGDTGGGTGGDIGSGGVMAGTGGGNGGGGTTGGGGGTTADACASAIFCDDFEKYTTGQAPGTPWTTALGSGTAAVDTTQFHSGGKSVKFTTQAKDGTKTAYIRLNNGPVFPVTGNAFYGRMMFRLEAAPTASVHWTLIQGTGLVPGQTYRSQYRYGGQQPVMSGSTFVGSQLMANYETPDSYSGKGPSSDCWFHANKVVVPVGKWSCVEWQFDGPNNTMKLWLDGAAVDSLTVKGVGQGCVNQPATYAWTAPTFATLDLGWESYQTDDARTLWIDDVAIGTSRLGCPP